MEETYVIFALCIVVVLLLFVVLGLLLWILLSDRQPTYYRGRVGGTATVQYAMDQTWQMGSPSGAMKMVALQSLKDGRQFRMMVDHPIVLGRITPGYPGYNEIGFSQSVEVSKRQCMIFMVNQQLFIQNLSQVNCTLLNGNPIWELMPLHDQDMIQVADEKLLVYLLS